MNKLTEHVKNKKMWIHLVDESEIFSGLTPAALSPSFNTRLKTCGAISYTKTRAKQTKLEPDTHWLIGVTTLWSGGGRGPPSISLRTSKNQTRLNSLIYKTHLDGGFCLNENPDCLFHLKM